MRRTVIQIVAAALGLMSLVIVAGCGRGPAAPELRAVSEYTPATAAVQEPESVVVAPVLQPLKPVERLIGGTVEATRTISGTSGGTITASKVTVTVPPNAYSGSAQITVTVPDSSRLECHLQISPASKNNFATPVRLQFELPADADPRVMSIYWYDENNGAWVTIPTTYNLATRKVWSELPHFSTYKADCEVQGRAGW